MFFALLSPFARLFWHFCSSTTRNTIQSQRQEKRWKDSISAFNVFTCKIRILYWLAVPSLNSTLQKIWIFLTKTPLRIARNSPNWKSLANMRVLEGVVHPFDLQHVAKFSFTKRTVLILCVFAFRPTLNDILRPLCRDLYWIKVGWQSYQTELWLGTERNGS